LSLCNIEAIYLKIETSTYIEKKLEHYTKQAILACTEVTSMGKALRFQ